MPRVMTPGYSGPEPAGTRSPVAPTVQRPPCPRVSITRFAKPAPGRTMCSVGTPRPPPYPMKVTTNGRGSSGATPAGRRYQPRMRSPSDPENSTSQTGVGP